MERDVFFYVKKALERSGAKSERQLCLMMGMADNTFTNYRKRNVLPNEETILKLAKIGGIDPFVALLDLNAWRNEGDVRDTYKALLKKITSAVLFVFLLVAATPSIASESGRFSIRNDYGNIHYHIGRLLRCKIRVRKALEMIRLFFTPSRLTYAGVRV